MDKNLSSALRKANIASREKGVIRPLASVNKHSFYKEQGSCVHVTAWTTLQLCRNSITWHWLNIYQLIDTPDVRKGFYSVADEGDMPPRGGQNNTAIRNVITHRQQEIIWQFISYSASFPVNGWILHQRVVFSFRWPLNRVTGISYFSFLFL